MLGYDAKTQRPRTSVPGGCELGVGKAIFQRYGSVTVLVSTFLVVCPKLYVRPLLNLLEKPLGIRHFEPSEPRSCLESLTQSHRVPSAEIQNSLPPSLLGSSSATAT